MTLVFMCLLKFYEIPQRFMLSGRSLTHTKRLNIENILRVSAPFRAEFHAKKQPTERIKFLNNFLQLLYLCEMVLVANSFIHFMRLLFEHLGFHSAKKGGRYPNIRSNVLLSNVIY
jgi:hypothetical protein